MDAIYENYPQWLLYSFMGCFFFGLAWELMDPWIKPRLSVPTRWWNTIGLYLVGQFFVGFLVPLTVIATAFYAQENSLGLLSVVPLPVGVVFLVSVLAYDGFQYFLHRIFHRYEWLWRLHRVHHSDPDVDVSTELKHHPLEALVTSVVSVVFVGLMGFDPLAMIVHALFLSIISPLSHANIHLPQKADSVIRWLLVTPAMHRVHHSAWQPETNSNYGTLFSFWDRLFASYVAEPQQGYLSMTAGLHEFRQPRDQWLDRLLLQPWVKAGQREKPSVVPDS